jgi:hypothetical protein
VGMGYFQLNEFKGLMEKFPGVIILTGKKVKYDYVAILAIQHSNLKKGLFL